MKNLMLLGLALLCQPLLAATPPSFYNVRDYGAVGNGSHLETAAINRAISACAKAGGGTVYLPPGHYLSGTITLQSHVTLDIENGATLLASQNPADYPLQPDVWGTPSKVFAPLIYANGAHNITLTGRGTINGQGAIWWHWLDLSSSRKGMPRPQNAADRAHAQLVATYSRPQLIRLVRCQDVAIENLNLENSPEWNIHPLFCQDVRVDGVTITAPPKSHNTDGINPESCRNVRIANCRINNGDDCITLKSGKDEPGRRMGIPDENITITNCVMLHGHGGVTIGSEMSGGVHNVAVTNCVFNGTDAGIRIKSERGRGGVVSGLTYSNIVMQDVPQPIIITTFYMGKDTPSQIFPVNAGTPRFHDILISDITIRGAKNAGSVTGLRELPIQDITFTNVHIQAATGFTCTNAQGITFNDVVINTDQGPAMTLHNSTQIDTTRLQTTAPHPDTPLVATDAPAAAQTP
jgi:polygalacturonase